MAKYEVLSMQWHSLYLQGAVGAGLAWLHYSFPDNAPEEKKIPSLA